MRIDDREYYRRRAQTEQEHASQASRADVAAIHHELARQYEALAKQAELRPRLSIVKLPARSGDRIKPDTVV